MNYKILIGLLLVLLLLGSNYIANIPQATQDSVMEIHSLSTTQFNLLYSLETLPSMFLIIPMGMLFDIMGTKLLVPSALLLVIGQFLMLFFCPVKLSFSFQMMILGRVMQGISGQVLYMALGVMTNKWMGNFSGIILVLPQLGQIVNVFLTPILNLHGGLYLVNTVGITVCLVSFVSSIALWRIDKKVDETVKQGEQSEIQKIQCSSYSKFPQAFWLIIAICAINEGIFIPSLYNANTMLEERFGIPYKTGGGLITIPFSATMIATGVFALLLKRVQKNVVVIIAAIGGFLSHSIIYYIPNSIQPTPSGIIWVVFSFIIFGTGKGAYYAAIYPSVGFVVPKEHRGTAYATVSLMECLGITFIPVISGWIIQIGTSKKQGYANSSLLFMVMGFCGMLLCYVLVSLRIDILSKIDGGQQSQVDNDAKGTQSVKIIVSKSSESKQSIV